MSDIKAPFACTIYDSEPVEIKNPFSGATCVLSPLEVAVYDTITGANLIGDYKTVRKGLDWFIKHNIEAYMILLD
jgi:hypothetical protein